jgi:hypothetical protein
MLFRLGVAKQERDAEDGGLRTVKTKITFIVVALTSKQQQALPI